MVTFSWLILYINWKHRFNSELIIHVVLKVHVHVHVFAALLYYRFNHYDTCIITLYTCIRAVKKVQMFKSLSVCSWTFNNDTAWNAWQNIHDDTWDGKDWGNEKMKMSCLKWDLNPRHSALQTDCLTNWATNAAQLAGSKSNISYRLHM